MFGWFKKQEQCNDYLTRLDSKELANLQDVVRNGLISVRIDIMKAMAFLDKPEKRHVATSFLDRAIEKIKGVEAKLNENSR